MSRKMSLTAEQRLRAYQETERNLLVLVRRRILNADAYLLYWYYKRNRGKRIPNARIASELSLAPQKIREHTERLEQLQLVKLSERHPGKSNIVLAVKPLTNLKLKRLEGFLSSLPLLSNPISGREEEERNYYTIGVEELEESGMSVDDQFWPNCIKTVVALLPSDEQRFKVIPEKLQAVKKIAKEFDLEKYTKWFVEKKLGVTVNRFSLSIFTYDGIVREYRNGRKRSAKSEAYKHTAKGEREYKEDW